MKPWTSYWQDGMVAAVTGIVPASNTDIVMSADRLTAYRTLTANGTHVMALSTQSGLYSSYVEIKTSFATANDVVVGIANRNVNNNIAVGTDAAGNSIGWTYNGAVFMGGTSVNPNAPTYVSGDVLAILINGQTEQIWFRNVTQNIGWNGPWDLRSLGRPPYYLAVSITAVGEYATATFYPPFVGSLPTGNAPGVQNWNAEALFSEQPVKVLDFDAVIADGNYSSTGINNLVQMWFSYIKWGDATVDPQWNLHLTDWDMQDPTGDEDDWPIFSITITASAEPADNYLWAAWDFGTPFVFSRFHITTTTANYISNIPIPPPQGTAPNLGEGHILTLSSSCSTTANFSWTNGRVFGTENVLVWAPIETATWPPSVLGIVQPNIPANVIQSGRMGPPIGPPLGS